MVLDGAGSVGADGTGGGSGLVSAGGAGVGDGVSSCFTFFFARFALFFLFFGLAKIPLHLETIADPR